MIKGLKNKLYEEIYYSIWNFFYLIKYVCSSKSFLQAYCRFKNHGCGVVWYTGSNATEPDMTCKRCGEDLG